MFLWAKYTEGESSVIYLLIFISGVETDQQVIQYIRKWTKDFQWYYYPRGFKENPNEVVINDLRVLNEAFIYSLKLRSLALIEYILNSCENLYINPSLTESHISPLLIDHEDKNVQKILKLIVTKDVIIVNDGSLKLAESLESGNDSDKSDDMMFVTANQSQVRTFKNGNKNYHLHNKSQNQSKTLAEIDDPVLFKSKKSPFNKYLDKVDLVEIAIREPQLSNNHEKQI